VSAFFRGLRADFLRRVESAEASADAARSLLSPAHARLEWFARKEAWAEMAEKLSLALRGRLAVVSDWTDRPPGPGRGELQATFDPSRWTKPIDPTAVLFRMGDIARSVVEKYPPLRTDQPDGGLLGRIRFEVRMARYREATGEGKDLINSILSRLPSTSVGYRRERRRIRSGRFVPAWYDVRNITPATLRAMSRIDQLKAKGIEVKSIVLQAIFGKFRTKVMAPQTRKRYEVLAASGLVFGRGKRKRP